MLRKTVLVRALSVAFATAALTAAVTQPAMAQSNTVGIIFGTVPAGSANSVVLRNTDTNQTRTVQVDANGKFQASGLAIGHYRATLMKGNTAGATSEVDVIAGQGAEAIFPVSGVQSVQVQGRRTRIDVSNTNNGAVFTARELARLPIAPSVASIVQLAPNTTRGDPRYAAGDSFGGGGPSENAYYINGFPVTNPLTQLGASELPFGAIAQAQVLTGGYGAEFGRSVGGVVNITTKSGTNNWEVGAQYSIEPNAWRSKSKNYMYENTKALDAAGKLLNGTTDGQVRVWRENNTKDVKRIGAYVGGPLIKDKLFMFLSGETTNTDTNFVNTAFTSNATTPAGWIESRAIQDRYVAKFDWNVTDNHRLEFTKIGDDAKADRSSYGYNFNTHQTDRVLSLRGNWSNDTSANGFTPSSGGDVQMLKYTGNITDDLTISALAGDSNVRHTNRFAGISTLLPGTAISSGGNPNPAVPIANPNPVTFNITPDGAADKVKAKRLDLEYKIATHTLRAGLDRVKMSSINAGQETAGGATWTYFKSAKDPSAPISMGVGTPVAPASGGQSGLNGFYVRKVQFSTSTSAASDQTAEYLEDKWQVTKNLLVTGGIRREGFTNRNGDNETFLKQDGNYSPRLSAAWDVNGDASFKVYGSAGRYFVQIPTNVTVRGASRAINTQQFYTYSGIDANGQPLGLVQLTAPRSSNNEFGQAKDPRTITATNLKPTYQDEVTLGFEKAFSPSLNFGVKGTYRKLRSTADDYCDQTPFDNWAARNGVSTANWKYGLGCVIMNPGEDQTFLVDFNNADPAIKPTLTTVKLTAAEIGLPKTKRIYSALDFFAEHPLRDGWYGKVNYTLAKNHGNTEGQTNSDTAQANVSITAVWDFAQIMEYSDGELPNSRKHQIKAFGYYQATPEWTVGGNFLAASGRPKGCLGIHPLDSVNNDFGYGAAFHYCKQSLDASGPSLPAPRGTLGQYPWDVRLDMNLVYSPAVVNGLSLKLDVFNVTNRQTVQVLDDTRETSQGFIAARAGAVLSYTAARSARFTVEYNKKF